MSGDRLQLDYAPPPPGRRWRLRRWLIIAACGVALWGLATHGPDAVQRMRLLWVQGRCARFDFPGGTVIFDSDSASRAGLLANPDDYVALDDSQVWPVTGVGRREPGCWASLKDILFAGRAFWPPGPTAPKAMVHRLRSANGLERLVAIIVAPSAPIAPTASPVYPSPGIGLVAAIVQPGTWDVPPRWDGNSAFLRAGFETARRLRFFAAQLDAQDASRFSIVYEMDGRAGTVDGQLEDDGNVSLKVRDGPAKRN